MNLGHIRNDSFPRRLSVEKISQNAKLSLMPFKRQTVMKHIPEMLKWVQEQ